MNPEILWYVGQCLFAWGIGWAAGAFHRALAQVVEAAS
jgi:hypothetical protein